MKYFSSLINCKNFSLVKKCDKVFDLDWMIKSLVVYTMNENAI